MHVCVYLIDLINQTGSHSTCSTPKPNLVTWPTYKTPKFWILKKKKTAKFDPFTWPNPRVYCLHKHAGSTWLLPYNHNITIPQYVLIYTQIYPVGLHYINDATYGIIVAGFPSKFLWIYMRENLSSLLTTVSMALSTLLSMLSRAQGQLIWHLQAHGLGQPALPFAT